MKAAPDASSASPVQVTPGQLVRAARERKGLSREALAYEAQVSSSMLARLELNDRLPATLPLARIAARLQINVSDLLPQELRVPETAAAASP